MNSGFLSDSKVKFKFCMFHGATYRRGHVCSLLSIGNGVLAATVLLLCPWLNICTGGCRFIPNFCLQDAVILEFAMIRKPPGAIYPRPYLPKHIHSSLFSGIFLLFLGLDLGKRPRLCFALESHQPIVGSGAFFSCSVIREALVGCRVQDPVSAAP